MNEKIKALAKQAGWNPARPPYGKFSQYDEFDHDKFAELIVRECAKFLDENSGYDGSNNAWHPEPEDLLEHFGVEQ